MRKGVAIVSSVSEMAASICLIHEIFNFDGQMQVLNQLEDVGVS